MKGKGSWSHGGGKRRIGRTESGHGVASNSGGVIMEGDDAIVFSFRARRRKR